MKGTSEVIIVQVDDIVEKIYANMSACHLKNENWKRAVETADKVGVFFDANLAPHIDPVL